MGIRIGLGLADFSFSDSRYFWHWVNLCEDSDVDSLWQTDRLISETPNMEPVTLMAALAGHTTRIKFGMNVVVLPFRDPLILAKECATIDYLSNGRLLPAFGVGGRTAPEWKATGREYRHRGRVADEMLDLIIRLWTEERVNHSGENFLYSGASIEPKPVQNPLPIWIGGSSRAAICRTARVGHGWIGGLQGPEEVGAVVAAVRNEARTIGRFIADDHYGAAFAFRFGDWDDQSVTRYIANISRRFTYHDPRQLVAIGDAKTIIDRIKKFRMVGVSKFILRPIAINDADIYDQTQRLIETVLPVFHTKPTS